MVDPRILKDPSGTILAILKLDGDVHFFERDIPLSLLRDWLNALPDERPIFTFKSTTQAS